MHEVTASWRPLARGAAPTDPAAIGRPLAEVVRRCGVRVIGIAGAPGSGKTTIAQSAADVLRNHGDEPVVLSMDDYYLSKAARAKRGIELRGPPGTHDVDAFVDALEALAAGRVPVVVQRFSPALDDQVEPRTIERAPTHLFVEGWVLGHREDGYGGILDRLDVLVFIDLDDDTAKRRRFQREAGLREHGGGFSEEGMNRFWDERIAPGLPLWVSAARRDADVVIELRPDGAVRRVTTSSPLVEAALGDAN